MQKYFSVFKIALAQEFVYKYNFIIWRVRNIIQVLVFFFLWNSVFENNNTSYFGYTHKSIIAYFFLLIFIRAIVMSSKSSDVSGHISSGDLSNYLLKPIEYFKYLIVRDVSTKILNVIFSLFEISIIFIILKPDIYIQTNILQISLFIISILIAIFIFFNVIMLASSVPFWIPELGWGSQFLIISIFVEFLSGAFFPLDVFPKAVFEFLKLTPFPYIVFMPIKAYLGAEGIFDTVKNLLIGGLWSIILWLLMNKVWKKGLKVFEAVGR